MEGRNHLCRRPSLSHGVWRRPSVVPLPRPSFLPSFLPSFVTFLWPLPLNCLHAIAAQAPPFAFARSPRIPSPSCISYVCRWQRRLSCKSVSRLIAAFNARACVAYPSLASLISFADGLTLSHTHTWSRGVAFSSPYSRRLLISWLSPRQS